ncbi:hypothetical protein [Chryseobacterium luquanense]|uniref:Polysaccharide biosynthesis protein n=1 Tax=Chryseobacterium luquanense TaxID=2983766 RepID=A0ABT3XZG0_9FLAO|nr:hypothetical protein [Chryseobacterium luquanense]MCX8531241.1 hypothetical protein [Chryseobacterium luquanense]
MKTFIKYDYYIQIFVFICFIILLILDIVALQKGYSVIGYFVIAAFHTISFIIRIFLKNYSKSITFKTYAITSLTVLISLLLITIFKDVEWLNNFLGFILLFGIPLTPFLAICYLIIVHTDYEKFSTVNG